ncbi:MAG TPA: DUF2304 domain-containing protein [Cellulomonas sp.]|nr:DUF2304 domain-containing protein [Cellulomonas sp.]
MWIKVILLVSISVVSLIAMRAPRGARHVALRRIAMLAFIAFAVTSVLFPEVWNALANAVGVGRGTDLLLYILILVFLGYTATSYLRFRGMEAQITLLARRIALDEAGVTPVRTHSAINDPPAPPADGQPAAAG